MMDFPLGPLQDPPSLSSPVTQATSSLVHPRTLCMQLCDERGHPSPAVGLSGWLQEVPRNSSHHRAPGGSWDGNVLASLGCVLDKALNAGWKSWLPGALQGLPLGESAKGRYPRHCAVRGAERLGLCVTSLQPTGLLVLPTCLYLSFLPSCCFLSLEPTAMLLHLHHSPVPFHPVANLCPALFLRNLLHSHHRSCSPIVHASLI